MGRTFSLFPSFVFYFIFVCCLFPSPSSAGSDDLLLPHPSAKCPHIPVCHMTRYDGGGQMFPYYRLLVRLAACSSYPCCGPGIFVCTAL